MVTKVNKITIIIIKITINNCICLYVDKYFIINYYLNLKMLFKK